ncbi:MAG: NifB/NifX family molybdenum-iron cluster-binding protein [Pirellulales bacterium]|nr:NifB/NifX family molybdenum-iron cluster-binding protein [Pirellulales bacterium]
MKIAVTAQGPDRTSPVDPRFGRAKMFVVFDTQTNELSAHDNSQNLNAAQGAGIQAGRTVVDLGVQAVLTGNVGPKAFATLAAGGIAVYLGVSGTVGEAIEQFQSGGMSPTDKASVEGHWM